MFGLLKPNRIDVGNKIRLIKNELGVSLTEIGNRLGLIKPTINSYIQGYSLAPLEVIEKLAKISGKKVGWFYFGEIEDYIRDYLLLKGYDEVLSDYPQIPLEIKADFLTDEFKNPRWKNEFGYPTEEFLDDCFSEMLYTAMRNLIISLSRTFVETQTILEDVKKEEIIILMSADIHHSIFAISDLKYEDKEEIKKMIEDYYNENIKDRNISFDEEYLVGKLINILNDNKKTIDLIHELSTSLTDKHFNGLFGGKELITLFQSMRPALIKIYAENIDDDFYDWFEK